MKALNDLKSKNYPQLIPEYKKPERRLLSVFMSLMEAVPSFRGVLLKSINYNTGAICSYFSVMEPHFDNPKAPKSSIPDGLLICTRGKSKWSAFIEAKAGKADIDNDQIQKYIDLAAFYKIDSVISISNEFALNPTELPYTLNKAKRKSRDVYHLSWPQIRAEIGLFLETNTSCTEAERRILREVHRYLSSKDTGVQTFDQMPESWKDFVKSSQVHIGFTTKTAGVNRLAYAWQQERRDLCIKLSTLIGETVKLNFPVKLRGDEKARFKSDLANLANDYQLEAEYAFPQTKALFNIVVEMRNNTCNYIYGFPPPIDKKAKATITWLSGILSDYSGDEMLINIV